MSECQPLPLGAEGLNWLYIQAANLYGAGVDKLPMVGRCRLTLSNPC